MANLGAGGAAIYARINLASKPLELDQVARLLWEGYSLGRIGDDEATFLSSCIERRRPLGRHTPAGQPVVKPLGALFGRLGSRFTPRQRQRSPDRKASRDRRRMLGGSSALPDNLRCFYTEGQRAVLCIIAGEVKRRGTCDFPNDKIAALAGVCRTTVQTTMHEARRLGHIRITDRPVPGRKHLPNVVEVISPEWRAWLKRGPSAARSIGSKPVILVSTTKSKEEKKQERKWAGSEVERGIGRGPPPTGFAGRLRA